MRFGSSTMFLREKPVTVALEVIARAGFAAAEVWVEHLWHCEETSEQVRQRARDLGLILTLHATSYDVNVTSSNAGIRRESIRQMAESLEIAARLEASVVTMHPGRLSSSGDSANDFWGSFVETVAALDEKAVEHGLRLGIEGMEKRAKEFFVFPPDLQRLFHRAWKATGLTVDLAHAQTVMNPFEYLDQIPPHWIVHVHCSDNSTHHTHLPLGQGNLDLPNLLAALRRKYDGLVSLEGYVLGQGEQIVSANAAYLCALGFMTF